MISKSPQNKYEINMDDGFVDLVLDLRSEPPKNIYALHNAYWNQSSEYFVQGVDCTSVSTMSFYRWASTNEIKLNMECKQLHKDFPMLRCFKHDSDFSIEFMCLSQLTSTLMGLFYFMYCDMHTENKESYMEDTWEYFDRCKNRICELCKYDAKRQEEEEVNDDVSLDSTDTLAREREDNEEDFRTTNFDVEEYVDDNGGLSIDFYFDMDSQVSMMERLRFHIWSWKHFDTFESNGEFRKKIEEYSNSLSDKFLLDCLKKFYNELLYNDTFRRLYVRHYPYVNDPDLIANGSVIGSFIPDAANYVPKGIVECHEKYPWVYYSCLLDLYCDFLMNRMVGESFNDFRRVYIPDLVHFDHFPCIVYEPFTHRFVALLSEEEGVYTKDAIDAYVYIQEKRTQF